MTGSTIWAVLLAAGITSALFSVLIGRLNKHIEARDQAKDEKEQVQIQYETMMIDLARVKAVRLVAAVYSLLTSIAGLPELKEPQEST